MIIAHITDLHIGFEGEFPYEVDVRARFRRIVAELRVQALDAVVVGGDLCYRDGFAEIYGWIREELKVLSVPVFVIPGNHDDTVLLAEAFGFQDELKEGRLYYERTIGSVPSLFLDTAEASLSNEQLDFLAARLRSAGDGPLLIFMHHPPVKADVYYMDLKYPLLNMEEVQQRISSTGKCCSIFCGHYHADKTVCSKGIDIYLTPSTFVQIDQQAEGFQIDHRLIGWRRIRVDKDTIISSVHYLEEE